MSLVRRTLFTIECNLSSKVFNLHYILVIGYLAVERQNLFLNN